MDFRNGGKLELNIAPERNIFFYVVGGKLKVNEQQVEKHTLVEYNKDGSSLSVEATSDAILLLGHAEP